jgi:SNF family Na+-dependent transporter
MIVHNVLQICGAMLEVLAAAVAQKITGQRSAATVAKAIIVYALGIGFAAHPKQSAANRSIHHRALPI